MASIPAVRSTLGPRRRWTRNAGAIAQTGKGGRNNQLNLSAYSLGQLVGGKYLSEDTVRVALLDAARTDNLVADEGKDRAWPRSTAAPERRHGKPEEEAEPEPQTEQKRQDAGSKPNGSKAEWRATVRWAREARAPG